MNDARVPRPDAIPDYRLPGQGQLQIWLRSYAPFKVFGGGYDGDGRGPSADVRESARIVYILTFDWATMHYVRENALCHASIGHGLFPKLMAYTTPRAHVAVGGVVVGRGEVTRKSLLEPIGRPGRGFAFTVQVAASNPLIALAPDIDVQLNMRLLKEPNGTMSVSGNLAGDAFPDCEVFLRDAAGTAMLLYTYRTAGTSIGGPLGYLPGHNFRPMGHFSKVAKVAGTGCATLIGP